MPSILKLEIAIMTPGIQAATSVVTMMRESGDGVDPFANPTPIRLAGRADAHITEGGRMPNRSRRETALPCPVLDWANNPRSHADRDRLQHLVKRIHTRHALRHASADVKERKWCLHIVSDVTGRLTTVPASLMVHTTVDGATLLPPPTHYGRDLVAELAAALDQAGRHVTHPVRPAFHATLLEMAVIRSACGHDAFSTIADLPLEIPRVDWREDRWNVVPQLNEGSLRPGNARCMEYTRSEDQGVGGMPPEWSVRRTGPDWEFDRHHIHLIGATLPESIADACRGRAFDDLFEVPELRGAGLVVRAVKNSRRAGRASLRVTVATTRLTSVDEALAMSHAMDAASGTATAGREPRCDGRS